MTAPDSRDSVVEQLRGLVELAERATPGDWYTGHLCRDDHGCTCPFVYSEGQAGMGAIATVGTTDEDVRSLDEAKANQALIASAVNFIRAHGPEVLQALARGPQQAGGEDAVQAAARIASEAACLHIDNERLQAEVARLQRALNFWLPTTAQVDPAFAERVRDDAMLLMGYTGDGDALCYHDQATHPAEAALREAGRLLRIAACPNEDCEDGAYHAANGRPARCQFCCERDAALNGSQDDA